MTITTLLLKNKASFKWKLKQWQDIPRFNHTKPTRSCEEEGVDWVILMGHFQLEILYDSVILQT